MRFFRFVNFLAACSTKRDILCICLIQHQLYCVRQCNNACTVYPINTHSITMTSWERGGVSNHQPHDSSLNRLSRRRPKKISKLRVTGLCGGNSPVNGEFPAQRASDAENVSIWWRHDGILLCCGMVRLYYQFLLDLVFWLSVYSWASIH